MSRLFLTCALFALACSSSDDAGSGGSGGSTAADSGPDVTAEADPPDVTHEAAPDALQETSTDAPAPDAPAPDAPASDAPTEAMPDAPADVANDVGPVSSCDELSTVECFANNECETERRCENAGTENEPVPCCVLGARGTGQAADACIDENDCESGVCIAGSGPYMCSKTCTTNDDCPDGMKNCTFIAFSTSNDKWCLPTD